MQTVLGRPLRSNRRMRGSEPWALALCIGFIMTMLLELTTIRLVKGADGRWLAKTAENMGDWFILLVIGISLATLVCGAVFLYQRIREWVRREPERYSRQVTGTDVIYTCAWLQLLNISYLFLFEILLPAPAFAAGSIGSLLGSASLQMMILVVVFFRFFGRAEALGLGRPQHLGKMLLVILGLFLLIIFALDHLVTTPLSDLLNLSVESEREQQIEQEISSAQQNNILNFIASALVIGVMVPFAEELLFRGVIQTYLTRRLGAWLGIGLSGLWFALLHIDIALFAPLFLIGLALGFVRYRFNSLWGAILLHSLNNLMSMVGFF